MMENFNERQTIYKALRAGEKKRSKETPREVVSDGWKLKGRQRHETHLDKRLASRPLRLTTTAQAELRLSAERTLLGSTQAPPPSRHHHHHHHHNSLVKQTVTVKAIGAKTMAHS